MAVTSPHYACRTDWRRQRERELLRELGGLSAVDEAAVFSAIDRALTVQDATVAERLQRLGAREAAMQEARLAFAADVRELTEREMTARDLRLLRAAAPFGLEGLRALRVLGELNPPWMRLDDAWQPARATYKQLAANLDQTRTARSHMLGQKLAAEVSARRGRHGGQRPPRALAHPAVCDVLSAGDVQRLREGGWVEVAPKPPFVLGDMEAMRRVERDLREHVRSAGSVSTSSCNLRARTAALPLLGEGFPLSPSTLQTLSLLAALPAEIERHGWPRRLSLPPLVQLGCYSAESGSRYSSHLDRNEWEQHNRREITILLYCNVGWDAALQGGCLRLHPPKHALDEPAVELEPVAGRLVLFPSATQLHEVLPCSQGERLALTLWVEFEAEPG